MRFKIFILTMFFMMPHAKAATVEMEVRLEIVSHANEMPLEVSVKNIEDLCRENPISFRCQNDLIDEDVENFYTYQIEDSYVSYQKLSE